MSTAPRILIVDESAESREVLATLVERQGAVAVHARRADQAAELAQTHRPRLIVFDAESDRSESHEATQRLADAATDHATPVIILGSVRRHGFRLPSGQFVSKPYHYGPLIRRIEGLLAAG